MTPNDSRISTVRRAFLPSLWSLVGMATLTMGSVACGGGSGGTAGGPGPDAPDGTPEESGSVGGKAPELSASPVTGDGPSKLADASGKVVIVDFWATYCDPCKKSFPKYQELVDQFGGDLAVIAVSVDDPEDASQEKLEEFVKATGVKFSVVWDKEQATAKKYSPPKMPTSFVIDRTGIIRHVHAGYETGEEEVIEKEVQELLE